MPDPKPRKKILYLITKSNFGGAQRYVFDLATHLNPSQYDVVVALGGNGRLKTELDTAHIRVIPLTHLERDISFIKEFKSAIELFKILRHEKPDIFHINSSKAGGLGGFIGRMLGVPQIIFTAHGWAFNEERPTWQKIIIRYLHWLTILLSHKTIAVSETTKKQMPGPFISHKMEVVHNGRGSIDFLSRITAREYFLQANADLSHFKDDFWSCTIGELHPVKQHDVVIQAIKETVATLPSVRHIIIGDGEERDRLLFLIKELDLEKNVFLIKNENAAPYLKAFDLFILGSRSEALAYVVIEASAAGLPIIVSNVGGLSEIITHEKNGLLIPSGDVSELARCYSELVTNTPKRHLLGNAALLRSQDFTLEQMLEKTQQLYNSY